jgi:tetratricopeptide (TPR) repeat protein
VNYRKISIKMKRIIPVLLMCLLSAGSLAGMPDSLYYRANEKYQAGEFETAIELYQQIIKDGYESSSVYFNLGNAYFRSNKLGKSRIYYEKALKSDPNNEDAITNLKYIEVLLVDKFDDIPELFLRKWVRSVIFLMNSDHWALISMITFVISLVMFSLYLFLRRIRIRKSGFYSGISLFFIALVAYVFSWQQYKVENLPSSAVVIESLVNVKSTPRETGTDLFVLHEGAKVWLEDIAGEWQEIKLSDGRKGWVPSTSIEDI